MQQEALDQETVESAMGRVNGILHPNSLASEKLAFEAQRRLDESGIAAAPKRKVRKDKGVPKPKKQNTDEIVLKLTLDEARNVALAAGKHDWLIDTAGKIQDQIIAQLQKRIDALTK